MSTHLTRVAEELQVLFRMQFAEERLVYGHPIGHAATASRGAGQGRVGRGLMEALTDLVEPHHSVRLEAAHVLMGAHAAWTEELGAVGASGHGLVVRLAARAVQLHLLDGHHVQHVDHDMVVFKAVNAVVSIDLEKRR